jgi:ADP-heptose:LPS heptosyltransferase
VAWAGAPRSDSPVQAAFDRRRSLPPAALARLLAAPGVQFFSLQKDSPAAPIPAVLIDFMAEMEDFADTAALIANLDLVISVDTAVAHLAAAMGKPVWLLNRFDTCWRWLVDRADTPWYPTMRIFRQRSSGDWDRVIDDVTQALASSTV